MGCFSWITQDTKKSVKIHKPVNRPNIYYLYDNKGNVWKETAYEGHGVFGGKDYFILLYEMNDKENKIIKNSIKRQKGIEMYYSEYKNIIFPNIVESRYWKWRNEIPKDDPYQGW